MNDPELIIAGLVVLVLIVIFVWRERGKAIADLRSLVNQIKTKQEPTRNMRTANGDELSRVIKHTLTEFETTLHERSAKISRLESTLDQISDGVLIINAEGKVTFANPSAQRIFSSNHTIIGSTASLVLRHHDLIQLWQDCQSLRVPNTTTAHLNFGQRPVQVFAIPDLYESGVILHIRDLTDLRKTDLIRRDFISNISHELRTPLASVKALAETMLEYGEDDPAMSKKFTQNIITEVDALSQMAAELLELTRIESGQVPFDFQPVEPRLLLEKVSERLSTQIDRAGITLTIDAESALPMIKADPPRLEQVMVNLLHNAIKFTLSGGSIKLSASVAEPYVLLKVIDTGIGIPEELIGRVFERFFRADSSRTGGGTGLGLSIAKHIVEGHHGKIEVQSTEGKGSEFTIQLPIWEQ